MNYAWHEAKKKRPQHLLDSAGKSFCQTENTDRKRKNSQPFTIYSDSPAPDRAICRNCQILFEAREPDLSVLMGERMA